MKRLMTKLRPKDQTGFTLVELLVMAPIMIVTIVLLMSYMFNQFGQLTQQGAQINLQVDAQAITFSMQDDIFFASNFAKTTNTGLSDSYQPSGGWQYNTTPQTLIISSLALTHSHRSADRQPVYINTEGCDETNLVNNAELYNNIIYFASGTNLYKRILTAPASVSTCGASHQKQSCPKANASTTCPADRLLTDKLNGFTITYLDTNNTVVSDPEVAERVKIDIQLKDRAFAEDIFSTSSVTYRKLN